MATNFPGPADEMLTDSRTKQGLFLLDKADFEAFDSDFADPFGANFLTSIEASEAMPTAETRTDLQKQETADVKEVMANVAQVYAVAMYFITKAFAAKPDLIRAFGRDNYSIASRSQSAMKLFLKNMHTFCQNVNYKPLLLAANMTQAKIDAIETIMNTLIAEDTEQNVFIATSAEATAARDAQYNETFGFPQKLSRASKALYVGNVVKLNQYKLPLGTPGEDFNVSGKITDGSNNNTNLKGVKARINSLNIETFTNFAGNWGFVEVPPGTYTVDFTLDGYTPVSVQIVVTQSGEVVANATLFVIG